METKMRNGREKEAKTGVEREVFKWVLLTLRKSFRKNAHIPILKGGKGDTRA